MTGPGLSLNIVDDLFGDIMRYCWKHGAATGVAFDSYERSDGLLTVNDAARLFAPFEKWAPSEQQACKWAKGRVLDVGCGVGRHALHLQKHGVDVIGIEPSKGTAAVARDRGVEVLELKVEDVGPQLGRFDTVLLGGQNIGLLESRVKAPKILSQLSTVAASGAQIVGVGIDPHVLRRPEHIRYAESNLAQGRMAGQQRSRIRDGINASRWYDYLFASPAELDELAHRTPWILGDVVSDGPNYVARFTLV